ncbi:Zinc-finger domain-containing protein [Plasmodiophora brassicae]|uniref:Zinc-finger domain-containing protein n=1 Tax=Plasmodiophora brassicae TaxID=37360 RepID=A0A0G4J6L8_PLABS|nr:hypothetical protein PBRA_002960 [Plasmodiophora brassicae]SPQ95440.1 unnamed protein product [Plasmodiophora brassicae]
MEAADGVAATSSPDHHTMERLWDEILDVLQKGGIKVVVLKYVDTTGALVEVQVDVDRLNQDSVEEGVVTDAGDRVYPNPTTAILNPFAATPFMTFICDMQKRLFDPIPAPARYIFPVTVAGRPTLDSRLQAMGGTMSGGSSVAFQSQGAATAQQEVTDPLDELAEDDVRRQHKERSYRGTSCHQCKNARSFEQLAFCSNQFSRRSRQDKRTCRKKYCDGCLTKCYGDSIENAKNKGWICPSCAGICKCAACGRLRAKAKSFVGVSAEFVGMLGGDYIDPSMSGGAAMPLASESPSPSPSFGKVHKH